MAFINPSYGKKQEGAAKLSESKTVRKLNKDKPRKKRCDAKFDIRVYVTEEEKRIIKYLAYKANMPVTPFCTLLLKKALTMNFDFPEVVYKASGKPVEIKLEKEFNDILMNHTFDWDCSKRKAAHRILSFVLKLEGGTLL